MATRVPEQFIKRIQGQEFVKYPGLLHLAHEDGLKRISTELVQNPSEENQWVCIFKAVVETEQGTFEGYGDASPKNVNTTIAPHFRRVAETRAKARALRDATNVGMTAFEELGENDDPDDDPPPSPASQVASSSDEKQPAPAAPKRTRKSPKSSAAPESEMNQAVDPAPPPVTEPKGIPINAKQIKAIYQIGEHKGMSESEVDAFVKQMFNKTMKALNYQDASIVIRDLQTAGNGKKGKVLV